MQLCRVFHVGAAIRYEGSAFTHSLQHTPARVWLLLAAMSFGATMLAYLWYFAQPHPLHPHPRLAKTLLRSEARHYIHLIYKKDKGYLKLSGSLLHKQQKPASQPVCLSYQRIVLPIRDLSPTFIHTKNALPTINLSSTKPQ